MERNVALVNLKVSQTFPFHSIFSVFFCRNIKLAKEFEKLVLEDKRFEISFDVIMALVCFRLKGTNEINEKLLKLISEDGRIHIVPSNFKEKYYLRFAVCATSTTSEHVQFAWKVITEMTDKLKV
ncbi:hypothetical protein LOTGIDRAFT_146670 [Lottia gigantea]|uniref:Aromatic-L-amino-acid decarboxylase n=1 Tax=Lottia gigantea TaxID=225164 RepID=V3YVY9_LOTGI|nr:hypothetical protein LOTGIDRAFT_146670 [Lottia gigantea]ESO82173.1 hypothetical protein LOTGIDRAFT_146670 [Lottia gigantea]